MAEYSVCHHGLYYHFYEKQKLIRHCKHCRHLDQDGYCSLKNQEIEIPNWTTCINWNIDDKKKRPLFAIVPDNNKYFELPYWLGKRPEAKLVFTGWYRIVVKDENGEDIALENCESYLRNYYSENDLECPIVSKWENLKLIIIELKTKDQWAYSKYDQNSLFYYGRSHQSDPDILYPPIN